jgi:Fe-S-cluster containining protein
MTSSFSIPPAQKFTCSGCGDCCRDLPVPLSDQDIARIEKLDWGSLLAPKHQDSFYEQISLIGRAPVNFLRRKDEGEGCVFLGQDNLCAIHAKFGSDKKPFACRTFPFQFVDFAHSGTQTFVTSQFVCKSIADGSGALVKEQEDDLKILNKQLPHHFPSPPMPESMAFNEDHSYQVPLLDQLNDYFARTMDNASLSFTKRLLISTRFADLVMASRFKTLDHPKRMDFIATLYEGTVNHVKNGKVRPPETPPNLPEKILFSQILGFRTLNHSPIFLGRGGALVARASLSRFAHGLRWMIGWGKLSWPWPPLGPSISLARILSFAPKVNVDDSVASEALTRYFSAAFHGRKLFEINLRKRAFIPGLGLLLRQAPTIMLFARASALGRDSSEVKAEDYARALRLADLSFGQFPYVKGLLGSVRRNALMDMRGPWFHLPWVCQ